MTPWTRGEDVAKALEPFIESGTLAGAAALAWHGTGGGRVACVGWRDREAGLPTQRDTIFRIASMTKSFTALAIIKLRDEDKLSLEDPVSKWIPENARMELPTRDSPPIRVRQLKSHSAGIPEHNPRGDQQHGASDEARDKWQRSLRMVFMVSPPRGRR